MLERNSGKLHSYPLTGRARGSGVSQGHSSRAHTRPLNLSLLPTHDCQDISPHRQFECLRGNMMATHAQPVTRTNGNERNNEKGVFQATNGLAST